MTARNADAVDHRLRRNSSNRRLSREDVVRSNVKHVALNSHSKGRNRSNNPADSRSRPSVGPVRLRQNDQRNRHDSNNNREASA